MRSKFSKIVFAAFAVNSALSMAFADIPKNCVEELITLSKLSQANSFDMQAFINNLPPAVAKAKLQAKATFGQPKDSDIMDLGMTFGCLKDLPESPSEIASLFSEINQVKAQPQVQYVYVPQPCPKCLQCPQCQQCSQYPQSRPDNQDKENYHNVQWLIDDGLEKNKEEIQEKSLYLSYNEAKSLYNRNKKRNALGWAALGGTVGLGIGNYAQGNIAMGAVQSFLDVLGYGSISVLEPLFRSAAPTIATLSLVSSRIMGIITPFFYQSSYNRTLADALNNNSFYYSYSIDPLIIPKNGAPAVGLAFNLRY
jgi:hypothetical protein